MASENTQRFWTALFDENGLIPKLPEIAGEPDGRSLPTKEFGQVKVKAAPASAMGDNFLSDTFIVEAKTDQESKPQTGFIKVLPLNEVMRQAASLNGVYSREVSVYRDLFPLLRDLRGDRHIPLDVSELYYARLDGDDNTCVLLEDLKAKGFKVTDKTHGADYYHARLAVISLAHYHSLTMTALRSWKELSSSTGELIVNYPDRIKFIKEKSMLDNDPVGMLKGWLEVLIEFTEEVQRPDLAEWLKRDIQENLAEIMKLETLESAGEMACILHGDYWNNNFMFHYDANGQPDALRMVDFQIVRIGHPLNDLLYFFYSSTRPELRGKHLMGLLRLYFLTLKADLELLDAPLDYSWNKFEEDFKKRSRAGFLMGGLAMSFILSKSVVSDLQDIDKEAKSAPVSEEPKEMGEHGMTVEMEEKMTNMIKNPSQKWISNKILTDRMIKLVDEIKKLNS